MLNPETLTNYVNYMQVIMNPREDAKITDPAFMTSLKDIKLFVIEDDTIDYLSPEYTNNKIGLRKMPFDKFIVLNTIRIGGKRVRGMIFTKIITPNGEDSLSSYFIVEKKDSEEGNTIQCQTYTVNIEDTSIRNVNKESDDEELKWTKEDKIFTDKIRIFMCNFLDFMLNPDVKVINVERTKEQNQKRIKRGKVPLPNYGFIKVQGELKIYLDRLSEDNNFSYSHKFWVRGHFRTLRSEKRYGTKVGSKIWIPPYIKGKGILLEKIYEVQK